MDQEQLTGRIIGCAMRVHRALGAGFLESVYRNALAHELRASELGVTCEQRLSVRYRDVVVGDFAADLVVDGCILVEVKAVRTLAPAHHAQLVNYLTATRTEIGLLINFGAERLEFRRKARTYRPGRVEGALRSGPGRQLGQGRRLGQDGQDEQDTGRDDAL